MLKKILDLKSELAKLPNSFRDLRSLIINRDSIRTSSGVLYGGKNDVWARDRAITGEDLINIKPKIAKKAILDLARFQGTISNLDSGEEPGRIHTEHREIFNNKRLGLLTKLGISFVSGIFWRTGWKEYTNYYSSDTTPLFIKIVCEYAKLHPSILNRVVRKRDGSFNTVRQSVFMATKYIEKIVSDDGLIRIKEHNLAGNQFRYWRDSPNSYQDEKSSLPNIGEAMVILDVQGLSAEALDNAANLFSNQQPDQASKWRDLSTNIRNATINKLWMPTKQYFAYGMDQDTDGQLKLLSTIQSNAGWLLNSDFFDYMSESDKQMYMTGIINRLFSDELLTNAGIRCRSKNNMYDRNFHSYHGSWVTWPVDSYMIAKGLRRQGFCSLADQIEARFINAVNMSGINYEFFIVDKDGKVLLDPNQPKTKGAEALPIEMKPEKTIAWTVTATLRSKHERFDRRKAERNSGFSKVKPAKWINDLEKDILSRITNIPIYSTRQQIRKNRYAEPNLYIDQKTGFSRASKAIIKKLGLKLFRQTIGNLLNIKK